MDTYSIVVFDSENENETAVVLIDILQNNPLYKCHLCSSLDALIQLTPAPTVAIVNSDISSITKIVSYLKKCGSGIIFLTDDEEKNNLYGVDSIYPIISKPLRRSDVVTTVALTIQNLRTTDELKLFSHFSTLLNKTLGLLQGNTDQSLDTILKDILLALYEEFSMDIMSIQIRDDQFDATFQEILLLNGQFITEKNTLFCQHSTKPIEYEACLCDLMRELPEKKLQLWGTPESSVWTNDISDFIEEMHYRESSLKLTPRCQKMKYPSLASIRIKANNELIGLIIIGSRKKNALNENTIRFFEDLAAGVGDLIWKRQLSENIKEVHSELDQAYKAGNFAMWKYYIEKDLFYFSEDFFNLTGKSNKLNQSTLSDFLISIQYDDRERVLKCFNDITEKKMSSTTCEFRFRNMDSDKLKYFKISLSFSEKNNSIRGVLEDITDKEVALLTVQDTKEFLNSILDGIDAAIIVIDPLKNYIVDINKRAEAILHMSSEEVLEIKGTHFLSSKYFKKSKSLVPRSDDSQNFEELLLKGPSGTLTPIIRNMVTTSWRGRKHYVVIIFDITDRKNLERQLNHAQKMESIGSLAAGIAHEINTPMQYIGDNLGFIKDSMEAYTQLLQAFEELSKECQELSSNKEALENIESLKEDLDIDFLLEEAPLALDQALDGVARVTKIVKAMKKFSHPGEEDMAQFDINDIIQNTTIVAKNEWKYFCDLEEDLEENLPLVYCNGNDISQVILNMVVNASHAIEDIVKESNEKGKITIRTKSFEKYIHIYIADTGSGIDPENYENIFNPFFTTKEVGKGTGQGLSMAYSIITEKHKGALTFTSEKGKGTEFTIELPLIEEKHNE